MRHRRPRHQPDEAVMPMAESFAHLLRRHRVAAGLSQETLAELSGVSVDSISALERGARQAPYKTTLDLLIAALALDDVAREEIEDAARLARVRGPQAVHHGLGNLPPQLTSFVDRENVLVEIKELLKVNRLVTVVGTGGAGKTRCAIKVGAELVEAFDDGVWLVELASISDPSLVEGMLARILRVREVPNSPILDTLVASLKHKRLLLILDNCEHLIGEACRVAAALLRACPDLRILATSRERFNIAGEQAYRIPSLPVPSPSELQSADQLSHYGAVQLFSDRAISADNRFAITVETAPHVVDICRRLDGIPLAIELAAARVTALSPRQLAQTLDERFRVLTGGDRSALPRHRTMRALIDWSYDLLSGEERALFRKLSIFAGGFTLKTATAVCGESVMDDITILDLLSSLVDKSLVQSVLVEDDVRYRLLESTRAYAREKLRDAGEEQMMAHAHALAFLALAEQLHDAWETTPDRVWHAQVERELENFRAALSWAFDAHGDILLALRITGMLRRAWYSFDPAEGRRWLLLAQQRVTTDTPASIRAVLDLTEAAFTSMLGQYKASLPATERALAHYRQSGDPRGIASAILQLGRAHVFLGNITEGETLLGQALEINLSLDARRSAILTLETLAAARNEAGDASGARQRYNEALVVARDSGAERWVAIGLINLAEAEFHCGDAAAALRSVREALEVLREFGDIRSAASAQYNMAAYLIALRRYDEARAAAREAVTATRDSQFSVGLAHTLQHLAATALLRPDVAPVIENRRRAARILGYVDARLSTLGALREYTEQQEYDAMLPVLSDAFDENELSKLMADGATWSEDQAVAEAMLI